MVRIQLHITERQARQLGVLARKVGTTRAELLRRGAELVLAGTAATTDPLLGLVAVAGPAGRADVSEMHDELLYGPPIE